MPNHLIASGEILSNPPVMVACGQHADLRENKQQEDTYGVSYVHNLPTEHDTAKSRFLNVIYTMGETCKDKLSGSTLAASLILPAASETQQINIIVGHTGDSTVAIFGKKHGGDCFERLHITKAHDGTNEKERERLTQIQQDASLTQPLFQIKDGESYPRFKGILQPFRAFGDAGCQPYLIYETEIATVSIDTKEHESIYIVHYTDGVILTEEIIADLLNTPEAANSALKEAFSRQDNIGHEDDATIVITPVVARSEGVLSFVADGHGLDYQLTTTQQQDTQGTSEYIQQHFASNLQYWVNLHKHLECLGTIHKLWLLKPPDKCKSKESINKLIALLRNKLYKNLCEDISTEGENIIVTVSLISAAYSMTQLIIDPEQHAQQFTESHKTILTNYITTHPKRCRSIFTKTLKDPVAYEINSLLKQTETIQCRLTHQQSPKQQPRQSG